MTTVTIYQFSLYNPETDGMRTSRRWGTREAIAHYTGGKLHEDTAADVPESAVNSDLQGLTARDFNPHASRGFQTTVR